MTGPSCSPSTLDLPAQPIGDEVLPDGSVLVADEQQALVWRVPPGGGTPTVWYFDGYFGITDVRVVDHGTAALLTVDQPNAAALAGVWRLPIGADGLPSITDGPATPFWVSQPGDSPIDMTVADDGTAYVSNTVGSTVVALDTSGNEIARFPSLVASQTETIPVDGPTYLALSGNTLLVSNTAFLSAGSIQLAHLAVLGATVASGAALGGLPSLRAAPPRPRRLRPRALMPQHPRRRPRRPPGPRVLHGQRPRRDAGGPRTGHPCPSP